MRTQLHAHLGLHGARVDQLTRVVHARRAQLKPNEEAGVRPRPLGETGQVAARRENNMGGNENTWQ